MKDVQGVDVPETAREWQLYYSREGSEEAAQELTEAMETAFDAIVLHVHEGHTIPNAAEKALSQWQQMAARRADFGAQDTEPQYIAEETIKEFVQVRFLGDNIQRYME